MKAKEEAIRLVDRFKADTVIYTWRDNGYKVDIETSLQNAKNCALICVDEITKYLWQYKKEGFTFDEIKYYKKVEREISEL